MTITKIELTLTVDSEADAAYITTNFGDRSARTVPIQGKNDHLYGAIDLAADGTLLGIETNRRQHPPPRAHRRRRRHRPGLHHHRQLAYYRTVARFSTMWTRDSNLDRYFY